MNMANAHTETLCRYRVIYDSVETSQVVLAADEHKARLLTKPPTGWKRAHAIVKYMMTVSVTYWMKDVG